MNFFQNHFSSFSGKIISSKPGTSQSSQIISHFFFCERWIFRSFSNAKCHFKLFFWLICHIEKIKDLFPDFCHFDLFHDFSLEKVI